MADKRELEPTPMLLPPSPTTEDPQDPRADPVPLDKREIPELKELSDLRDTPDTRVRPVTKESPVPQDLKE